jgi:SAM-dependent methyltransferase
MNIVTPNLNSRTPTASDETEVNLDAWPIWRACRLPWESAAVDHDDARGHWERHANDWIALTRSDPDYELFNKPSFLDIVPRPGRLTLDVGCGEGRLARELTALGHHVVGIDGAAGLARAARTAEPPTLFALGDSSHLPIASGVADLVVCFMVLMDVDDLDEAVTELARVLVPGGVLCAAILHPIFTSGLFIEDDPNQTFYMGEYGRSMRHLLDVQRKTGERFLFRIEHRPLETYSRALEAAGFTITGIREPKPTDSAVAERPEFAKFRRVPEFLHLRARRFR